MSMDDRSLPECRGCFEAPTTPDGWCDKCGKFLSVSRKAVDEAFAPFLRGMLLLSLLCIAAVMVLSLVAK